jgi:DNA-binding MarR family transcriptional regulator
MADESKTPQEEISEALDLMVKAGWIQEYARDETKGIAVKWTEKGKQVIATIFLAVQDLGPKLNKDLWWTGGFISALRFGPGGKGFQDLGITEEI